VSNVASPGSRVQGAAKLAAKWIFYIKNAFFTLRNFKIIEIKGMK
jgi:hypothetical protein